MNYVCDHCGKEFEEDGIPVCEDGDCPQAWDRDDDLVVELNFNQEVTTEYEREIEDE